MQNKLIIIFIPILVVLLFSGCAKDEKLHLLENKISNIEIKNSERWEKFSKSYTPQMREELSLNLERVKTDSEYISKIKNDAKESSEKVALILDDISMDLYAVKSRMKELRIQNIIKEFNELKQSWNSTFYQLNDLVKNSSDNAASSAYSAQLAQQQSLNSKLYNSRFHKKLNNLHKYINSLNFKHDELIGKINRLKQKITLYEKTEHSHPKILR